MGETHESIAQKIGNIHIYIFDKAAGEKEEGKKKFFYLFFFQTKFVSQEHLD